MRAALLLLFALFTCLAGAQDAVDTHGKSEAQILQMGMDKWIDFYTSKEGTSTASMTEAAGFYGDVAQRRNDRLIKSMRDRKRAKTILDLRKLMSDLASSSVDIAYAEAGGGTMYNMMWASVGGVTEDALYALVTGKGPKPKSRVVSDVRKELAKIGREIEAMHADKDNAEFFKYGDAKKALAKMSRDYDRLIAIAKHLSRTDSDRILGFCLEHAKNAEDEDSSK
ncbi:MAG TPA: hypothetical protein VHE55_04470 [Fimbriimonadaceae bacterium]|nr:hypothetical protein [Fimbriimonadaceae bacterium]